MNTQGEIEAAICEGTRRFEQAKMGRAQGDPCSPDRGLYRGSPSGSFDCRRTASCQVAPGREGEGPAQAECGPISSKRRGRSWKSLMLVPTIICGQVSTPVRRWFLSPEPDDPVHVFRLSAEFFQSGHALPAVVLRVHGDLDDCFGNRDGAGGIGKPRDRDDIRQVVGGETRSVLAAGRHGILGANHQLFERNRAGRPWTARHLPSKDQQKPLLHANDVTHTASHFLIVASTGMSPNVKKDRVGPLGVRSRSRNKVRIGTSSSREPLNAMG